MQRAIQKKSRYYNNYTESRGASNHNSSSNGKGNDNPFNHIMSSFQNIRGTRIICSIVLLLFVWLAFTSEYNMLKLEMEYVQEQRNYTDNDTTADIVKLNMNDTNTTILNTTLVNITKKGD